MIDFIYIVILVLLSQIFSPAYNLFALSQVTNEAHLLNSFHKLNCSFTYETEWKYEDIKLKSSVFPWLEFENNQLNFVLYISKKENGIFKCNQICYIVNENKSPLITKNCIEKQNIFSGSISPQVEGSQSIYQDILDFFLRLVTLIRDAAGLKAFIAIVIYIIFLAQVYQISSRVQSSSHDYAKMAFIRKYGDHIEKLNTLKKDLVDLNYFER